MHAHEDRSTTNGTEDANAYMQTDAHIFLTHFVFDDVRIEFFEWKSLWCKFDFFPCCLNSNEDSLHSHNPVAQSAMRSAQHMRFNTGGNLF